MKKVIRSGAGLTAVLGTVALIACSGGGSGTGASEQAFGTGNGSDGGTSGTTDGGAATDAGAATGTDAGSTGAATQPAFGVCSDAQVAAILHVSNQGEIQLAQALRSKFQDAQVRSFADRMITDHQALDSALTSAGFAFGTGASGVSVNDVSYSDNGIVKELQQSAQMELSQLQSMSGSELDKAYIDHEVLDHVKDLGLGDHVLAPSAKDARLVAILQTARAAISAHAQLAVPIQTRLEGACGGPMSTSGGTDGGSSTDGGAASCDDGGTGTGM